MDASLSVFERVELYVVIGYLGLMIGIGVYFARRNKGGEDYFAGGRAIPWWVSGISLYMGNFSAWLFTGGAGMIYRTTGYGLLYFFVTGAVAYFLGSQMTAALWRRSRVLSPVELTRRRFGVATQQMLSAITSVVFIAAAGNQLRAIATVVEQVLGVPIAPAAVVIGIIVVIYTIVGGLWAVTITDVVQFFVLLSAVVVVAPLALGLPEGGLSAVLAEIDWSIPPPEGDASHNLHFLVAGLISFTLGVASGAGPRFYCVPDERSARKAGALAAALFLTTPLLFSIPSLVARAQWGGLEALGQVIPGNNPHERVFVFVAQEVLPPGLVGVFLAAMFAATMSALDSVYNQVASVLSRDVYMNFRPKTSDRGLLAVGHVMTLICGGVTVLLCLLYISGTGDLFQVMTGIFYMAAPVTAAPVLMGLLFRSAPRSAAMASMLWGIGAAFLTKFVLEWAIGPQVYLTQAVCLGAFLIAPWLRNQSRRHALDLGVLGAATAIGGGLAWVLLRSVTGGTAASIHFTSTWTVPLGLTEETLILIYSLVMTASVVLFARRYATEEDTGQERELYDRLDTPVDVAAEVDLGAADTPGVIRLIGHLTAIVTAFVFVAMIHALITAPAGDSQWGKYLAMGGTLGTMSAACMIGGRRKKQ